MSGVASGDEVEICSSPMPEHMTQDLDMPAVTIGKEQEKKVPAGFDQWAPCKKQAWLQMEANPNAFFYRHVLPDEERKNGPWTEEEKELFLKVLEEHPPEMGHWGLFARHIPGRVGYQCNAFYKKLVAAGEIPGMPPKTQDQAGAGTQTTVPERTTSKRSCRGDEAERAKVLERCKRDMTEYKYMYDLSATDCFHFCSNTSETLFRDRLRAILADERNHGLFTRRLDRFDYTAALS